MTGMNVAIFGSGGREHALAWRLRQSPGVDTLFAAPGNPGIADEATLAAVDPMDIDASIKFCRQKDVKLAVIGPEDPLAMGLGDALRKEGVRVFGPNQDAARLEADKTFAKAIMRQSAIPTAEAKIFTDPDAADFYVSNRSLPVVIKAAGLAKGKGVTVCHRAEDAAEAIDAAMRRKIFGDAGASVMVEEYLQGVECSILALVDRRDVFVLELCQDHKPVGEDNTGPMTGGMGAFSPATTVTPKMLRQIEETVFVAALDGLAREGIVFSGCLYAGLMLTPGGPKVLEFNVRFGDPETQPLMMRYKGDLLEALLGVAQGRLADVVGGIDWDARTAVSVVLASRGYPGTNRTGDVITGISEAERLGDVKVFHGGTAMKDGNLVTAGGRVLAVTALGDDIDAARDLAYQAVDKIQFDGMHYRRDIGKMRRG